VHPFDARGFKYTRFWATGFGEEFALGAMHQHYADLDDAKEVDRTGVAPDIALDKTGAMPIRNTQQD